MKTAHRAAALTNQMLAHSEKGQFVVEDLEKKLREVLDKKD